MGAIRNREFSVKEKYLNAIQHTNPSPLMLSPQMLLARSTVASAFHPAPLYIGAHAVKARATAGWWRLRGRDYPQKPVTVGDNAGGPRTMNLRTECVLWTLGAKRLIVGLRSFTTLNQVNEKSLNKHFFCKNVIVREVEKWNIKYGSPNGIKIYSQKDRLVSALHTRDSTRPRMEIWAHYELISLS